MSMYYNYDERCPVCGNQLERATKLDQSGNYIQERTLSCNCGFEEVAVPEEEKESAITAVEPNG
jgi:C4-type Zn-finger protein